MSVNTVKCFGEVDTHEVVRGLVFGCCRYEHVYNNSSAVVSPRVLTSYVITSLPFYRDVAKPVERKIKGKRGNNE